MESWYKMMSEDALNTGHKQVFGKPLEGVVPPFYDSLITLLENEAIEVEGIFRLSGNNTVINNYRDKVDMGIAPSITTIKDPHSVAGLLKYELVVPSGMVVVMVLLVAIGEWELGDVG
eukprot:TRINITY_DN22302_c0_g1_i1.p1 TRINITY_DN22302_c0_g1~~TRINITY_DN22302_c0_g1_i1.p1  ORF type:complete len:118 (+),score=23.52 TRINITY_DN22302_c0_g1_i1:447-800(+)